MNTNIPLNDYPRPQLSRTNWTNLNGKWDYTISPKGENIPSLYEGTVVVPFPIESQLSGVRKTVGEENEVWYRREFSVAADKRSDNVLLHFGAVDWESEIFVNGQSVGIHQGGFDPFSFEITGFLAEEETQELVVRVWDPTDKGPQPRGKQVQEPQGIWYTPITGIWQTVWMEFLPETYISKLKTTPDWDRERFLLEIHTSQPGQDLNCEVGIYDGSELVCNYKGQLNQKISLKIPNPKNWTPDSPHLYNFDIKLIRGTDIIDSVRSYGALRKISVGFDAEGNQRMELNGQQLFQYGPLDQGWWPDGLYTAPTDEALAFDIIKTKEMGFNMIRKHAKLEPARWYYHCDTLGVLVWQDMPSGDLGNRWESKPGIVGKGTERKRTPESENIYKREWKAIIDAYYNFPCIVVWTTFNEAWGQFKTKEISDWTKAYDPTRLVNSASGGNFELEGTKIAGEIFDIHNYPDPAMPCPDIFGKSQVLVLGEYGGLGLQLDGHTWQENGNWGYQSFKTPEELLDRYKVLIRDLKELIPKGLAAAVYTQTTDVEIETNGLMTYDRKVIKFPVETLRRLHEGLYKCKIHDRNMAEVD